MQNGNCDATDNGTAIGDLPSSQTAFNPFDEVTDAGYKLIHKACCKPRSHVIVAFAIKGITYYRFC